MPGSRFTMKLSLAVVGLWVPFAHGRPTATPVFKIVAEEPVDLPNRTSNTFRYDPVPESMKDSDFHLVPLDQRDEDSLIDWALQGGLDHIIGTETEEGKAANAIAELGPDSAIPVSLSEMDAVNEALRGFFTTVGTGTVLPSANASGMVVDQALAQSLQAAISSDAGGLVTPPVNPLTTKAPSPSEVREVLCVDANGYISVEQMAIPNNAALRSRVILHCNWINAVKFQDVQGRWIIPNWTLGSTIQQTYLRQVIGLSEEQVNEFLLGITSMEIGERAGQSASVVEFGTRLVQRLQEDTAKAAQVNSSMGWNAGLEQAPAEVLPRDLIGQDAHPISVEQNPLYSAKTLEAGNLPEVNSSELAPRGPMETGSRAVQGMESRLSLGKLSPWPHGLELLDPEPLNPGKQGLGVIKPNGEVTYGVLEVSSIRAERLLLAREQTFIEAFAKMDPNGTFRIPGWRDTASPFRQMYKQFMLKGRLGPAGSGVLRAGGSVYGERNEPIVESAENVTSDLPAQQEFIQAAPTDQGVEAMDVADEPLSFSIEASQGIARETPKIVGLSAEQALETAAELLEDAL